MFPPACSSRRPPPSSLLSSSLQPLVPIWGSPQAVGRAYDEHMSLDHFHPLVDAWFAARFAAPTDPQERGWREIAAGRHTLIAAPTGSGKTLAAFLVCLDGLVRRWTAGELEDKTYVVYVSPLKALS